MSVSDHTFVIIWVMKIFFRRFLFRRVHSFFFMYRVFKVQDPSLHGIGGLCVSRSVTSNSLRSHGLGHRLCRWNSPGQNTGVGNHSLLQRIFLTQGSNPGLPHCRQTLYCLSYQGTSISSRNPPKVTLFLCISSRSLKIHFLFSSVFIWHLWKLYSIVCMF